VKAIRHLRAWSLPLVPLALLGCGDFGDDTGDSGPVQPPVTVSFATDIQPIFDNNCIGCHNAGGQAGLDLRAGLSHGNLVGVASTESALSLVESGQPAQSWLFIKLSGLQDVGDVMPPGGNVGSANLDLVETWITEGALDN